MALEVITYETPLVLNIKNRDVTQLAHLAAVGLTGFFEHTVHPLEGGDDDYLFEPYAQVPRSPRIFHIIEVFCDGRGSIHKTALDNSAIGIIRNRRGRAPIKPRYIDERDPIYPIYTLSAPHHITVNGAVVYKPDAVYSPEKE